jgi:succinate dehydrogenase flavin-adding protein (antitoxin of CptAB toxin-antitoxin module)
MKELDLLLLEYLRQQWPTAAPEHRRAFAQILELPDPVLAAYLLGNADCTDESLRPLLAALRELGARGLQRGTATAVGATAQQS